MFVGTFLQVGLKGNQKDHHHFESLNTFLTNTPVAQSAKLAVQLQAFRLPCGRLSEMRTKTQGCPKPQEKVSRGPSHSRPRTGKTCFLVKQESPNLNDVPKDALC